MLIASVFVLNSCATSIPLKNSDKWLPQDFNPQTTTLLIRSTSNNSKFNNKMSGKIKKHYPYKYKVISDKTKIGEGTRYSDSTKYQYVLECKFVQSVVTENFATGGSTTRNVYLRDWHFVDIHTQKQYEYTKRPSMGYVTNLILIFNTIKKQEKKKK